MFFGPLVCPILHFAHGVWNLRQGFLLAFGSSIRQIAHGVWGLVSRFCETFRVSQP